MKRCYFILLFFSTLIIFSFISIDNNLLSKSSKVFSNEYKCVTSSNSTYIDYSIEHNSLLLKCNLNYTNGWSDNDRQHHSNEFYSQKASQNTHKYEINRAIIVYYPIESTNLYEPEFKWFYHSWLHMQMHEPSNWRTDIIIFLDERLLNMNKKLTNLFYLYNCSFYNKRVNRRQLPMCRLVKHTALRKRKIDKIVDENNNDLSSIYSYLLNNRQLFDEKSSKLNEFYKNLKEKLSNYNYLDSILIAFDGYHLFKGIYDYLVRSDMDVFLTPLFAKWLPTNCNDFYVGRGGYSEKFNIKRLSRIASNLNLKYAGIPNLGSTWLSTPEQFRLVSYLTLVSMLYLSNEEFSLPEKQLKSPILWPYWHYGVLLLYGQNLAMNHLIATNQLNIIGLNNLIDVPTDSEVNVNNVIHLHVFHGLNMFSKFKFKHGDYDNITDLIDDNNKHIAKYYALNIALESKFNESNSINMRYSEIVKTKKAEI